MIPTIPGKTAAGLLLGLALAIAGGTTAQATCTVTPRAKVPLEVVGGAIMVEAMINGRPARLVLDTGAQRSLVTPAAVTRLDLALDEWVATTTRGIGGVARHRNALPRSLSLGGVALVRRTTTRDTSLTVGTMPKSEIAGRPVDGVLGRDFLSPFDLALDMPARIAALHTVEDCRGQFLPWTMPYGALKVENPADTALVIAVELDGVRLRALLDTGASATVVTAPGIARLGLTPEALAADKSLPFTGIGAGTVAARLHQFHRLQIGELVRERPSLWVAPVHLTPIVDMVLGADWLEGKLVWISFATRQVFVARR